MSNQNYLHKLVAFALIVFFMSFSNGCNSKKEIDKFDIEDTSLINKIFLADRNGNTITLNKKDEIWLVNDQFIVKEDAINMLLSTANKIRVKRPVSKAAFDNVIKFMATTGIVVEFFIDNNMLKSYTIGSNTPDHLGTYMLLKDSDKPFVMHIPSFNGFLSPRYGIQGNSLDVINWRSTTVFDLSFNLINQIKYTDYLNFNNSYTLKTKPFQLINSINEPVKFNQEKVLKLVNSFEKLNCEVFKQEKYQLDLKTQIEELVVNLDTLRTYSISDLDTKTKEDNFTVARKYATLNNGEVMLIQDYVFNKVLINITELKDEN